MENDNEDKSERREGMTNKQIRRSAYSALTTYLICQAILLVLVIILNSKYPDLTTWSMGVFSWMWFIIITMLFSFSAYWAFHRFNDACSLIFVNIYSFFSFSYCFSASAAFFGLSRLEYASIGGIAVTFGIVSLISGFAQLTIFVLSCIACNRVRVDDVVYVQQVVVRPVYRRDNEFENIRNKNDMSIDSKRSDVPISLQKDQNEV